MRLICVGYNDRRIFGNGWYGLEKSPRGILYRASTPYAELQVSDVGKLDIGMMITARPEHCGEPLRVTLQSGKLSDSASLSEMHIVLETNGWVIREGTLLVGDDRIIRILTQNPWSPDRLYRNGDVRSLGILISSIRIG